MASDIVVHSLRTSFVWFASAFDLLKQPTPEGAPMARLALAPDYRETVEKALLGERPAGLDVPWPASSRKNFWRLCLGYQVPLGDKEVWKPGAQKVRRHLLPFRGPTPAAPSVADLPVAMNVGAFYYPFGTALVVTATLRPDAELLESVGMAHQLRREPLFAPGEDLGGGEAVTLDELATRGLRWTRKQLLGAAADVQAIDARSITTFIAVDGTHPANPVTQDDEVHRALDALAAWNELWADIKLPDLKAHVVDSRQGPDGHVVYGRQRGRVVWFPARHHSPVSKPTLSCLHRNLTLAAMHTEALTAFIADCIHAQAKGPLSVPQQECLEHAAGLLARLYVGGADTYRSGIVRNQIDTDPRKPLVNEARTQLGWPVL